MSAYVRTAASANTIAARESEAGVSIRPVNAQAPSAIAIESTPSTVAMLRKEQQLQRSTPHLHMQKRLLTLVRMDQPPVTEAGEHRQGQRELFSRGCQYHRLPRLSWIRKRSETP